MQAQEPAESGRREPPRSGRAGRRRAVRQCAWCLRVADAEGRYADPPAEERLRGATHGICPACWPRLRDELGPDESA